MSKTTPERNKTLVLEAFDTLFNKRDYAAAERYWSDRYIQHSAHISPGRIGLFNLIRTLPDTLKYENQLIVAEGDYVIAHGRFSGTGRPAAWVAADILRIEDGKLAEHWDVLQEEVSPTASGHPMLTVPGRGAFAMITSTRSLIRPCTTVWTEDSIEYRCGSTQAAGFWLSAAGNNSAQ